MTRWTPERIAEARAHVSKEAREQRLLETPDDSRLAVVLELARIGLKCIDPSPEDVERVAAMMFELDPAYRDSAGEQRIRFEDVRISNGDYWMRRARAALAAIAEKE